MGVDVVILGFLFAQDLPAYFKDKEKSYLAFRCGVANVELRPKHTVESRIATAMCVYVLKKET